jgi:hypothetical protein
MNETSANSTEAPTSNRLPYHSPVLRDHGTINELTFGEINGPPDDGYPTVPTS